MARTVDEIFNDLDKKDSVVGRFLLLAQYEKFSKYMPLDTEVSTLDETTINEGDTVIPQLISDMKAKAQKILDDITNEFNEALNNVEDSKKAALMAEFDEKKKTAVDGVAMINEYCDKQEDNWNKFKSGQKISFEDKYDIPSNYANRASSVQSRDNDSEEVIVQDEQDQQPQQEENDLQVDESKNVLQLMRELREARAQRRKVERALVKQRFKEFGESIEESGDAYLKSQQAKEEYKSKIKELKEKYNSKDAALDRAEEYWEDEIDSDRAELATKKGELSEIRKKPIIKYLEKAQKAKIKLEERLESATDEERAILEDKLDNINSTIGRMLETEDGKQYSEIQNEIRYRKSSILINKKIIESITDDRVALDEELKKAKEEAKANKANVLPEKQSKFKMFIGAIRAKLGIGKYKAEKNAKDSIENALASAGDFISRAGTSIADKAGAVKESVKGFVERGADKAISKLEQHINNRIAKEQQKTQDVQQKINPENEAR